MQVPIQLLREVSKTFLKHFIDLDFLVVQKRSVNLFAVHR